MLRGPRILLPRLSYKEAGVDIDRADRFVSFIKSLRSPAIGTGIGAFSGGVELDLAGYQHPLLLTATDGVGTKLLVAKRLERYDTVGIDLVAMCANDLMASGAKPLVFQDYIACGRLEERLLQPLVKGIVRGCELAGCRLTGGETAELPGMYGEGDFDLAGFCVGLVEKESLLPRRNLIRRGDVLLGLPSAGIHSNGLSLAQRVLDRSESSVLLRPTTIYLDQMSDLLETGHVLGAAHITGGGLTENIPRMLPDGLRPELSYDWPVPEIFHDIQRCAEINDTEMRRTFNLGLGMVVAAHVEDCSALMDVAARQGFVLLEVGQVV